MAIQFLPMLIQSLVGAGANAAVNSVTARDTTMQQAAPAAGGGAGKNPIGDFLTAFDPQQMAAINKNQRQPMQVDTTALSQGPPAPAVNAPTTDLEPIDMESLPKRRKTEQESQEIGDLIASIPDALVAAGSLLGLDGDKQRRKDAAPTAGGAAQNQYAGAFGPLPKPPSLGEILAALPRLR